MTYGTRRFNAASQGLSDNPYPETNESNFSIPSLRATLILSSHVHLSLPRDFFSLVYMSPRSVPFGSGWTNLSPDMELSWTTGQSIPPAREFGLRLQLHTLIARFLEKT